MRFTVKKRVPNELKFETDIFYENKKDTNTRAIAEYEKDAYEKYKKLFDSAGSKSTLKKARNENIRDIIPCRCDYLRSLGGMVKCNTCQLLEKRIKNEHV